MENNETSSGNEQNQPTPEEAAALGASPAPEKEAPEAHPVEFAPLQENGQVKPDVNLNVLLDVDLRISVEVGNTRMQVKDLLKLGPGSVVELDRMTNEPVDILVNDRPFAKGEIVVVEDNFGVRITDIMSPSERMGSLK